MFSFLSMSLLSYYKEDFIGKSAKKFNTQQEKNTYIFFFNRKNLFMKEKLNKKSSFRHIHPKHVVCNVSDKRNILTSKLSFMMHWIDTETHYCLHYTYYRIPNTCVLSLCITLLCQHS